MYQHSLPTRVRVLVLGGGIHGVGVLHDMASRGWQDIHLIEKASLAGGTSSRSTKLIHGGLRYLKRISEFNMVAESLRERRLLMQLAPDLVKPLEIYFPVLPQGGDRAWMVKAGLFLYDNLAGAGRIKRHSVVQPAEASEKAAVIDLSKFKKIYSFWDAQTDDLALVHRVAASAVKLGAGISEGCRADSITASDDGWRVQVTAPDGRQHEISALYVVNCLGPWANEFLLQSQLQPAYEAVNNKGVHLILPDMGLKVGVFMQLPEDGRIQFLLPWLGHTLLGTTEELYAGDPDRLRVRRDEVQYLLAACNRYLKEALTPDDVQMSFAGLRWLAVDRRRDLSATSRECVVGRHVSKRGLMFTIYGGKLTSYRSLADKLGNRMTAHFGEYRSSQTALLSSWVQKEGPAAAVPSLYTRFSSREEPAR